MIDSTQEASREEVEEFLATTRFTGYQAVPLPHGLALPGKEPGPRIAQALDVPLEGRSFLDVGSYYGMFPLSAIARGAAQAVGLEPAADRAAIAQRIAELHGGQATVESRLGVGSTFRLRLPASTQAAAAPG